MKPDNIVKWAYSFFMLIVTIAWAVFLVLIVYNAAIKPDGPTMTDLIATAGVGVLLGAMINWNGNINQFWFRKKPSDTNGGAK